jgi:uncharacterized protein (TIGR02147 family)
MLKSTYAKCFNRKFFFKPSIRKYFSATKFLNDFYIYRKKIDPAFSYELWAIELGFKSKSTLRMISIGERNLSEDFIEIFSSKEKFEQIDKEYFLLLAKLNAAKNIQMKKIYLDRLSEISTYSEQKTEIKNIQLFLSDLNLMRTQVLIAYNDFEATSVNIKKILGLSSNELNKVIHDLESMGLIQSYQSESRPDKIWKTTSKFFSVTDEAYNEAMNLYHFNTTKEASKAIFREEFCQKFKSLSMALSDTDFTELNEMLDLFNNKLKIKYGRGPLQNKRIYKVNLQAYPVSKKLE